MRSYFTERKNCVKINNNYEKHMEKSFKGLPASFNTLSVTMELVSK